MGAEVETLVAVSWKISVDAIPKQGGKKGIEKERERERERERGGGGGNGRLESEGCRSGRESEKYEIPFNELDRN